jgi:hypothetical protein
MAAMTTPPLVPDTKDWTWVLDRPCPECGFDPDRQGLAELPGLLRDTAVTWSQVLGRADARQRPAPDVWSALEYAAHVRDVHVLFAERLRLMRERDDPTFANWDQDATAVAEDYAAQDPARVAAELAGAAEEVAAAYATLREDERTRRGFRDNGSVFTVESLGAYHLHDVVHHLHDVGAPVPWARR